MASLVIMVYLQFVCILNFTRGSFSPENGPNQSRPGALFQNVPHRWILIEHLLRTRPLIRRTHEKSTRACFPGLRFAEGRPALARLSRTEGGPEFTLRTPTV